MHDARTGGQRQHRSGQARGGAGVIHRQPRAAARTATPALQRPPLRPQPRACVAAGAVVLQLSPPRKRWPIRRVLAIGDNRCCRTGTKQSMGPRLRADDGARNAPQHTYP
jgi:hypothetical protein